MSSFKRHAEFSVRVVGLFLLLSALTTIAQEPSAAQDKPPTAKQPAIPGLPDLPPGVELPDDVKALLNKVLQDSAKGRPAPAKAPSPAKALAPKKAAATVQSAPAATTFQRVATEKPLGPVGELDLSKRSNTKPEFWVSPDGRRFAYLIEKKGIVIDGQAHMYPHMYQGGIKERTFRFSPDSRHTAWVAYVGEQGDTLVMDGVPEKKGWNFIDGKGAEFSPDSQHIAYIARRYVGGGVEYALMIDGKERETFKESPAWSLSFTADGRRVVWGERVGERTQMRETSVDGSEPRIERTHGPSLMTINFFFGGGGQMGYVAHEGPEKHFVFYDGKDDSLRFKEIKQLLLSTDGKHLAYVAEPDSFREVVVVDGKPSKVYGGFDSDFIKGSLILSPDGRRSAYAIKKRNDHFAVIDGREGKAYRAVSGLVFSPDSKRVAYRAVLGNKLLIVVDGQEGPGYDELGLPVFSPDGKTVACGAGAGKGKSKFIVVNGKNQKAYGDVGEPVFSPDGKRLAYEAEVEAGGQSLLIDSGREGKLYDDIKDQFYFSDDGRHLAMVVFEGDHQMVVVDGVEGNRYDTVITLGGGKVHFDSADRFHYLAAKGGELYLVEETIQN